MMCFSHDGPVGQECNGPPSPASPEPLTPTSPAFFKRAAASTAIVPVSLAGSKDPAPHPQADPDPEAPPGTVWYIGDPFCAASVTLQDHSSSR